MARPLRPSPEALASSLVGAAQTGVPVQPLTNDWPELTAADAYAIQTHWRALRLRQGERLVGRKIGLTSVAMQEMLGVNEPDFGFLTDKMTLASGSTIPSSGLIAPRVEAEIAFRLGRTLGGTPTFDEVLAATSAVAPALEVIDSRIADWRIRLADTIADNASSALVVIGEFVPLSELDLATISATLEVRRPDNELESVTGAGDAVLGHPAHAVAWLATALNEVGGENLSAGEIILPGAVARAIPIGSGDSINAAFTEIGTVEAIVG